MLLNKDLLLAEEETLIKNFKQFIEGALLFGDFEISLKAVNDAVIGVGMGEQGYYLNINEMRATFVSIEKDDEEEPVQEVPEAKTSVAYSDIDVRFFTPENATVTGKVHVSSELDGEVSTTHILQMFSAAKQGGKWKFTMIAVAPIELTEEGIESYKYYFADNTLAQLKQDLEADSFELFNRGFSGGVMCTYVKENYPLCFANDSFIKMLGYEREEFEEYFKDNTAKMNSPESEEHMLKISSDGEQGGDFGSRACWLKKDGSSVWVEFRATRSHDPHGNPIFLSVSIDVTEQVELEMENRRQHNTIVSNVNYASKIQRSLLPKQSIFENAFSDFGILWQPRDSVGGDIYWAKSFEEGTVLCVCDCTGHGVSGAMLTMLVKSSLEEAVNKENYTDTAQILWELDQKFKAAFDRKDGQIKLNAVNDSCEAAALFIAKNGDITISSSNIYAFACNGSEVTRIKGQNIYIGEGRLKNKDVIKTTHIPHSRGTKFYLSTDGLIDQCAENSKIPFGAELFSKLMLENHKNNLTDTTKQIWEAFLEYKGSTMQRDDVEIICFEV